MRDIAECCECNQSTVSRALKNDLRIPLATRKRIQETAARMGWRPNPLVEAYMAHLHSTKTPTYRSTLAYFVTSREHETIECLPYNQLATFQGAQKRAAELGYKLEPVWLHEPGLTSKRLKSILESRGIPGLIIPGLMDPTTILSSFDWESFAAVTASFSLVQPALHRVAFSSAHGVSLALHKVFDLGYRRIGVALSRKYDEQQNHGLLHSLYFEQKQSWGNASLKSYIFQGQADNERKGIRDWILKVRPDVIIGEEIVLSVLYEMGWNIPGDIAYVSLDWAPSWPDIGGIDQRHEIMGAMALDLVSAQLLQNERGLPAIPKLLLLEGKWEEGKSIPAKNQPVPPSTVHSAVNAPDNPDSHRIAGDRQVNLPQTVTE